ncbi:MAG: pyridoxal-dependent decarboxylase [bacterium]|nr:pyridoxal-dependent decarboxylase [bacterium]
MTGDREFLEPCFLGPNAENERIFEELLIELVRDHAYWRRNFHPEDGPSISAGAPQTPAYLEFVSRMKTELYSLSAELKRAVPFFHPRYIGHMNADLLLPGVLARMVTTLYNPNNVSTEGAPVTLDKELAAGVQLADMFGFSTREGQEPCAWGHLTSGGTVANYEALWNFRSVQFYGIALQAAAAEVGFDPEDVGPRNCNLSAYDKWELLNLSLEETITLRRIVALRYRTERGVEAFPRFADAVRGQRIEQLGTAGFFMRHRDVKPPRVFVSASAHYSWEKGMKVLGFGTANLTEVPVDGHMRLDAAALREQVRATLAEKIPVLAVIGVLGTTEFGTIDPIHEIMQLREECRSEGHDFGVHVDAAWGGYLTAMFREPGGRFCERATLRDAFRHFPTESVYKAFESLSQVDSITVDPHKMGYVPYSAGAFVARDRRVVDFITQKAAYVFDLGGSEVDTPMGEKLRNLGQYILEGSKPGAGAASVYITHKVLPLHREGFGRLLAQTVHACEYFHDRLNDLAEELGDRVRISMPFEPDTNLVCLLFNPTGNTSLARLNEYARSVFSHMKVDPSQPLQVKKFIASYTSLQPDRLPRQESERLLNEVGIDPATFVTSTPTGDASDHIFILRHTLMNPWLQTQRNGGNYIDEYLTYLRGLLLDMLDSRAARALRE